MRKFVFLTFLEEEEVERFFHFLLALNRQEVFCLAGIGREFACGVCFLAADGA